MTNYELAFLERIERQNLEILKKLDDLNNTIMNLATMNSNARAANERQHDLLNSWCP